MTTFYLIRHGEPTYEPIDERKFIGHGRDLAALSENGIKEVKKTELKIVTECDAISLDKSILIIKIMDELRNQYGIAFPTENIS